MMALCAGFMALFGDVVVSSFGVACGGWCAFCALLALLRKAVMPR